MVGQDETAVPISVSTTKSRALIKITKILAPGCVIAYHCKPLKDIKDSFLAVVSISALCTQSCNEAPSSPPTQESRNTRQPFAMKPAQGLLHIQENTLDMLALAMEKIDSGSDSDSEPEIIEYNEQTAHDNQFLHSQQQDNNIPFQILADSFHIIDQLCKTIYHTSILLCGNLLLHSVIHYLYLIKMIKLVWRQCSEKMERHGKKSSENLLIGYGEECTALLLKKTFYFFC